MHAFTRRISRLVIIFLFSFCCFQVSYADHEFLQRQDVQAFIQEMVQKHQFKKDELIALFSAAKIYPQVIKHLNKPLEHKPWNTYQMLFVSEWRIKHGVQYWNKNAAVLEKAEKTFGIPASIIVATIGVETRYGKRTGDYRVIDSLTNIAFSHSPRANYFRKELEEFLLLAREEQLDPLKIMGSYAGAIGQPQFMPSSYRYYAINFSESGKTDLIHDEKDVIGSVANYYKKNGWETSKPIAEQAYMIGNRFDYLLKKSKITQPLSVAELMRLGVIPRNKDVPDHLKVKVIELENRYRKEYWLGFHNFDVIKRYNSSDCYAMAVYQLSTYITALRDRLNNGSR